MVVPVYYVSSGVQGPMTYAPAPAAGLCPWSYAGAPAAFTSGLVPGYGPATASTASGLLPGYGTATASTASGLLQDYGFAAASLASGMLPGYGTAIATAASGLLPGYGATGEMCLMPAYTDVMMYGSHPSSMTTVTSGEMVLVPSNCSSNMSTLHCYGSQAMGVLPALLGNELGGHRVEALPRGSADVKPGQRSHAVASEGTRTTVMLRNLPEGMTRSLLLATLDAEGFARQYDFVYLPIDFRLHKATGYAFINLCSADSAVQCFRHFNGFARWPVEDSTTSSVGWSDPHQGLQANIARYRNSPLMHELVPDEYRPALFSSGMRVMFPPPTKKIKPPRQGTERMLI